MAGAEGAVAITDRIRTAEMIRTLRVPLPAQVEDPGGPGEEVAGLHHLHRLAPTRLTNGDGLAR